MLFEQLKKERIQALKDKQEVKKNILGVLLAESAKEDKNPSDDKIISTIKKFIKSLDETMNVAEVNSQVYIESSLQKDLLSVYLPRQMSEEALRKAIQKARNHGCNNIGSYMKYMNENHKGNFDNKLCSTLIKEIVS